MTPRDLSVYAQEGNDTPRPPKFLMIRTPPCMVEQLADLAAAAARICELRPRGAGLRLVRTVACYAGSETFEATSAYVTPPGASMEDWVCTLVLPHDEHEALREAVKAHAAELRSARKAA